MKPMVRYLGFDSFQILWPMAPQDIGIFGQRCLKFHKIQISQRGQNVPKPRGLLVHDLPSGSLLDDCIIGSPIGKASLRDYDGDGQKEFAFASAAPANEAVAGGLADSVSYVGVLDLELTPCVKWAEILGNPFSTPALFDRDFDGDGSHEFFTVLLSKATKPVLATSPGTLPFQEATSSITAASAWIALRPRSNSRPAWAVRPFTRIAKVPDPLRWQMWLPSGRHGS